MRMKERGAKASMRLCIKGFSREETSLVRIMVLISFLDVVYNFWLLASTYACDIARGAGRAGMDSV
jgi:hypothetical protein